MIQPGIPLGHTIPAHRALGWCAHCPDRTAMEELAAWQTREPVEPAGRSADEVDVDTVANRAAQVITTMGAEIRELKHSRDRYRMAWLSARHRIALRRMTDETATETPDSKTPCRTCTHPVDWHDPHEGCVGPNGIGGLGSDDCPCTGEQPAAGARQSDGSDRIVAYRSLGGRILRCLNHVPPEPEGDFVPVTAEDLPDGGLCTHPRCGMDVLISQPVAEAQQDGAQP